MSEIKKLTREDLPPVGVECEFQYPKGRWNKGYYHGKTKSGTTYLHIVEYSGGSIDLLGDLTEFRFAEKPTPVQGEVSSLKFGGLNLLREKMGFESLEGINVDEMEQNLEDAQIEAKAIELYNIHEQSWADNVESGVVDKWSSETNAYKEGFRAIARHLATPQNDVQHALQAALESERELMDILRKIGKVFGKNVGVDIGILELPKLVRDELEEIDDIAVKNKKLYIETRDELEAHRENSKQIMRLNNWLQEHKLGEPGVCVTDTVIKLLDESVRPQPHLIRSDKVIVEMEKVIEKFKPLKY